MFYNFDNMIIEFLIYVRWLTNKYCNTYLYIIFIYFCSVKQDQICLIYLYERLKNLDNLLINFNL